MVMCLNPKPRGNVERLFLHHIVGVSARRQTFSIDGFGSLCLGFTANGLSLGMNE